MLAAPGSFTKEDISLAYESQKGKCWYCQCELNGTYHVDHRIPLSRGGSNDPANLVLACPSCNMSKGNKFPHEWNGRLL
ncbi:MAG TPA: HNH endonuclease signature motif containing protein [Bellilinea sp.]|nr:HNH endonuclease signature motif containing protein [Bellilinea sp.]